MAPQGVGNVVCSLFTPAGLYCNKPRGVSMPKDIAEQNAMDYKSLSFKLNGVPDDDGKFEGYASVFDIVDQGMDVVAPGAFRRSLDSGRSVKLLWQHDMGQPIGVWEEIKEDEKGLFVRGRLLNDVQQGREANALMRAGAIDSMSIGFRTKEAVAEGNGSVRRLTEIELFEVSLVTFPMLPDQYRDQCFYTTQRARLAATKFQRGFRANNCPHGLAGTSWGAMGDGHPAAISTHMSLVRPWNAQCYVHSGNV